jgi:hypothetical protein
MNRPDRIPFRTAARSGLTSFERAAYAVAATAAASDVTKGGPAAFARNRYGSEAVAQIVKAATGPASGTGWGKELSGDAVGEFISLLPSAGGKLLNAAARVTLDGMNSVAIPKRAATLNANGGAWVAPGEPGPVFRFDVSNAATVGPVRKLIVQTVVTRELFTFSDAEVIFSALMREQIGYALDAKMFSDDEATDSAPAGLLNNISALTASTATDLSEAMIADVEQLLAAVAPVAADAVLIANPAQAFSLQIRLGRNLTVPIWRSLAVPVGTLIAVDPAALVSGFGDEPQMTASIETAIVMQDAPVSFSTVGTPATVGAPASSMFQVDCVALKLVLRAAWALRAPAIAWLEGATWGAVAT